MITRKKNAFLILGNPRTGTTLLKMILETHPDVYCYGEPVSYSMFSQPHAIKVRPKHLGLHMPGAAYEVYGNPYWNNAKILYLTRDPLDTIKSMFLRVDKNGASMIEKAAMALTEDQNDPNSDGKKLTYGPRNETSDEMMKEESTIFNRQEPGTLEYYIAAGAWFCKWSEALYHAYRMSGYDIMRVQYENLTLFPKETLYSICEFLDLTWSDNLLNHHLLPHTEMQTSNMVGGGNRVDLPIFTHSINSGKHFFTDKEKELIYSIWDVQNRKVAALRSYSLNQFGLMTCKADALERYIYADPYLVTRMEIKDGMKVLDAGCGLGRDLRKLRAMYPNCELTGVDLMEQYIAQNKSRSPNINFHIADVTNLPFADNSFDVAYSNAVWSVFTDEEQARALKELKRVAKTTYHTEILQDLRTTVVKE